MAEKKTIPQWLVEKGIIVSMSQGRRLVVQRGLKHMVSGRPVDMSQAYSESDLLAMETQDGRSFIETCDKEWFAQAIEMQAADRSYGAGLGVSDWESFLTGWETRKLIKLAKEGYGTWGKEGHWPGKDV